MSTDRTEVNPPRKGDSEWLDLARRCPTTDPQALAEANAGAEEKRPWAKRRRRAILLMAASVLLLIVAAAGVSLWLKQQQARRQADTEREVAAVLTAVKSLHEAGIKQAEDPEHWQRTLALARAAFKRAEEALGQGQTSAPLQQQVEEMRTLLDQDERACRLFAKLDRLGLEASTRPTVTVTASGVGIGIKAVHDPSLKTAAFFEAYKEYGLDLNVLEPAAAAALIRANGHRARLYDEISMLAQIQADTDSLANATRTMQKGFRGIYVSPLDWSKAERLSRVLQALQPDPAAFPRQWHEARLRSDVSELTKLARSPQAQELTALGQCVLARDLISVRAFDEARSLLKQGLERDRGNFWLNAYLGLASVAVEPPAFDEAIHYFNAALAIRGRNARVYMLLANVLRFKGDLVGALHAAQAAVEVDPTEAGAHYLLGDIQLLRKDAAAACAAFHRVVEIDPISPQPLDALGQAYAERKGMIPEAIRYFRLAIERDATYVGAHINLGNALVLSQDLEGAIAEYRKAIKLNPDYGLAYLNLGAALLNTDIPGAIDCFNEAIKHDPANMNAYLSLGRLYTTIGDRQSALRTYRLPGTVDPGSAKAQLLSSQMLLLNGETDLALTCANSAVELEPNCWEGHNAVVRAYLKKGDVNEALVRARATVTRFPDVLEVHDTLGTAWYWKCEFDKAVASHRRALELNPDSGVSYENIGLALRAKGDLAGAAEAFRPAMRLNNQGCAGWQLLVETLILMQHFDEGIELAQQKLKDDPENLHHQGLLLALLTEKGAFNKAIEVIHEAEARFPLTDARRNLISAGLPAFETVEKISQRLPAIVRGEDEPASPEELILCANLCARFHRSTAAATGVRLYTSLFDLDQSGNNAQSKNRFHAGCCAALAGMGGSADGMALDAVARARLRRQALTWFRTDLADLEKLLAGENPIVRCQAVNSLGWWRKDPLLECVRAPERLLVLPTEERMEWLNLWEDVDTVLSKYTK